MSWVFVSRMMSIICFLIIVVLAKILTTITTPDGIFQKAADGILFSNFWFLIFIAFILFAADIFGTFRFPFNLPAPLIRAIGSVFCIVFILRVIQWVDSIAATHFYTEFWLILISLLIVPLIFLIVLASGYYAILRQLWWEPKRKADEESADTIVYSEYRDSAEQPVTDAKSWEEIGREFRMMLFDILHRFREDIRKKK